MIKFKALRFGTLLLLMMSFVGCKEEDPVVVEEKGSIYGAVTDFATGAPVANANVSLRPGNETALTGYDGMYEFIDVDDGDYFIVVSKAEYSDLIDDYVISVRNGRRMRRDVQIKKNPAFLRITDVNGFDISSLDFGSDPFVTSKSFNIFNNGTVSVNCSIVYSCNWIKTVSPIPNAISPGQNVTVNVEIDRSKLSAGNNVTDLYVTSNNGSNALKIMATGGYVSPEVLTLPATDSHGEVTLFCDVFHARITNEGNPTYTQRGFCYSTTNPTPTINDNRINVEGAGPGEYSYYNSDFFWTYVYPTRIYYRAWVIYGENNDVKYGNVQAYTYYDVY